MEKREPSCIVGGNVNEYSYYGEQCEACQIFRSSMQTLSCGGESSSPTRDRTPGPLHWELRALAPGSPGKSLHDCFLIALPLFLYSLPHFL